ncbi:UNVERIFIED_CONTAM: hypothetical protein Sangu_0654700 [Sesamum angustifolium]|uniref:CRM domain-containing protein n=1 Tax=Sesamum angustifolium TaxID=2727405 RepID=A0AAW2QCP9_9LAMI
MEMAALASSPHLILHRFILRRPTAPFIHSVLTSRVRQSCLPLRTTLCFTSSRVSSRSVFSSLAPPRSLENDVALLENEQIESEREADTITAAVATTDGLKHSNWGLGKTLKSQQVGKSGVTDTVVMALIETLEANELLKLKVHGTCPGELEDVVKQLEETTGSVVVSQIGRTVILYRPSLTKLKAEEKKKQAQRLYLKRQTVGTQTPQCLRNLVGFHEHCRVKGQDQFQDKDLEDNMVAVDEGVADIEHWLLRGLSFGMSTEHHYNHIFVLCHTYFLDGPNF